MTTTYLEAKYINSRSQNRNEEQAHEHIRKKDGDLAKLKQIDFSSIHLFKFVIIKEIKKVLKLLLWLLRQDYQKNIELFHVKKLHY